MAERPLSKIPVQEINRMVMSTEDPELLSSWLEEEKAGARRLSALTRIHHRWNILRARGEHAELVKMARHRGV